MQCIFKDNISDTFPFMQNSGDGHSGGRDNSSEIRTKTKNRQKKKTFFEKAVNTKYPFHQETSPSSSGAQT